MAAGKRAQWIGLSGLQAAVRRNPVRVLAEARLFLTRGMAEYKKGIIRNPWRVGGSGGGAPVRTGNLRDTHYTRIDRLQAAIGPAGFVKYAQYVHRGTVHARARPWLDYVKREKQPAIETLYRGMLQRITRDLAR